MPLVMGADTAIYGSLKYQVTIFGGSDLAAQILDISVDKGEFVTSDQVASAADVVVIGSKVKEKLFGDENPIGKKIRIKDKNLRVIGTLPKKGQVSFFAFDEAILLPYTTAQKYIFGIKYFNELLVQADSDASVSGLLLIYRQLCVICIISLIRKKMIFL